MTAMALLSLSLLGLGTDQRPRASKPTHYVEWVLRGVKNECNAPDAKAMYIYLYVLNQGGMYTLT